MICTARDPNHGAIGTQEEEGAPCRSSAVLLTQIGLMCHGQTFPVTNFHLQDIDTGIFRNTQKQQAGNKGQILLNKGTVPLFRSQLKMEAIVTLTVPMKPSLKPVKGLSVPS